MSMISSLIDELRKLADGQATFHDAREVMLEAADTIWQLRDDLQRANAENAALRQQLADVAESMGRIEERCAKLRELARDWFLLYRDHEDMSFKDALGTEVMLWKRMVELKVEVSE